MLNIKKREKEKSMICRISFEKNLDSQGQKVE